MLDLKNGALTGDDLIAVIVKRKSLGLKDHRRNVNPEK
jgi:hypothetical protein